MGAPAKKAMSYRLPVILGVIGAALCALCFMAYGLYAYWHSTKLINFLAAWIPFVLSVLFAFVPSAKEMKHEWIKWTWRTSVVIVGFVWSVMLWHQQDLADRANTAQTQVAIQTAVNSAVNEANQHSDQKFQNVESDLKGFSKTFDTALKNATGDIDTNLGKVGKPEPPERSKLVFSLWRDGLTPNDFPLESEILSPEKDGSYHIAFLIKNDSAVLARGVEEWVDICDQCTFTDEPKGFDRPQGMRNSERHRSIPGLNPGVSILEGNEFNVTVPSWIGRFPVVFKATCNTCGAVTTSKLLWITKSLSAKLPQ